MTRGGGGSDRWRVERAAAAARAWIGDGGGSSREETGETEKEAGGSEAGGAGKRDL